MSCDLASPTKALADSRAGLEVVDGIMSFMVGSPGKPSNNQRALYVSAVAFAYAVWENYVEELAVELATHLASNVEPSAVPPGIAKALSDEATNWEINVHPGWRQLWIQRARLRAKGDGGSGYGLSKANRAGVEHLFKLVGVQPFNGLAPSACELDKLLQLRNSVAHTGKIPGDLHKPNVVEWRDFVERMCEAMDKSCCGQAQSMIGVVGT